MLPVGPPFTKDLRDRRAKEATIVPVSDGMPYLKKINELAAYSAAEAARFLGIPVTTVRAWIRGQPYMIKSGERFFRRVIVPADPESGSLSFGNLIEVFVLNSLRRVHGVPLRNIRSAIERTRKDFRTDHPLSDLDLLTDRTDLFIEQFGEYLNLSKAGQIELKAELVECLRRIDKDSAGIPRRLFPRKDHARIAIDPRINFGRPSIVGSGILTEVVFERFASGEDLDFLAKDYRCERQLIQKAVEYERHSRKAAA